MSYLEMIERALKGRSVNAAAKAWHIPQSTLFKYTKGERLPDYATAKVIATDAGIDLAEAFNLLANEEAKRKSKTEKISESFNWLLRGANRYWTRVPATA